MPQLLLLLVGALAVGAIGFGIAALISGGDPGLAPVEPDGRAVPLPTDRPLGESDVVALRFDTGLRGYRMGQVDMALRRAAYDIGYKEELIGVLEAEVAALREGRIEDADALHRAREAALRASTPGMQPAFGAMSDLSDIAEDPSAVEVSAAEEEAVAGEPATSEPATSEPATGESATEERTAGEAATDESATGRSGADGRAEPAADVDGEVPAEGPPEPGAASGTGPAANGDPEWSRDVDDSWRRQGTKLG